MKSILLAIVPFESFTIQTSLAPEKVRHQLANNVEPRERFSRYSKEYIAGKYKPYFGEINGTRFEMMRITRYQNIFQPVIKGKIESEQTGALVNITMTPHPIIYALSTGLIVLEITIFSDLFTLLEIIAFCYIVIMVGFKLESRILKKFIKKLFK